MVEETRLSAADFIYPMFVTHGRDTRTEIPPMPGIYQLSLDQLIHEVGEAAEVGIGSVLLFGIPARKDGVGSEAYAPGGIIQEAIGVIKQIAPEMTVVTDVCLCEFTDHGHCGRDRRRPDRQRRYAGTAGSDGGASGGGRRGHGRSIRDDGRAGWRDKGRAR